MGSTSRARRRHPAPTHDVRVLVLLTFLAAVSPAWAQSADPESAPPPPPRVSVGGEITATYGSDDPGFFNYATYDYSPFRNTRVVLDASAAPFRRVDVLAQVRVDGTSYAQVSALYLRVRPWLGRMVDVQAGRIPPTFGLLGRAGYGGQEPFVGRPLAYGYLTSLRVDALPATVSQLLVMRGRGWLSSFPLGNTTPDRGLPLIDSDRWDTGAQLRIQAGAVEGWASVTAGSLGDPRLRDNNGRRQVASRVMVRPSPALTFGASAARGGYLSRSLNPVLGGRRADDFDQRALGADMTAEAGRWRLRGEVLQAWWTSPIAGARDLSSVAVWGDLRVRVHPGVDLAVRGDRLGFSNVTAASGATPWEAPVTRLETAMSALLRRHLRAKIAYQRNRRPLGGRVRHDTLVVGQLGVWF